MTSIMTAVEELQALASQLDEAVTDEDVVRVTTIRGSKAGRGEGLSRVNISVKQEAFGLTTLAGDSVKRGGFNDPASVLKKIHEAMDKSLVGFENGAS